MKKIMEKDKKMTKDKKRKKIKIPVEISARHIHISKNDLEVLFGKGYQLRKLRDLSIPPEFAAKETVDLINGDRTISNVRIVGPIREKTQVELSLTDAFRLGLNPPIRISGDLKETPGIILRGVKGKLKIKEGVIVPCRHLHCGLEKAQQYNLKNGQKISVKIEGKRGVIFNNVVVRVRKEDVICMHIDTDEGNSAGINKKGEGFIINL